MAIKTGNENPINQKGRKIMKRIMIDEYNNKFEVSYKTPQTFFNRHGGNSVLIQQDDRTYKRFERLPNGKIVETTREDDARRI